jgi:methylated-DNA-[protein]-cysteine S-methyltransferase
MALQTQRDSAPANQANSVAVFSTGLGWMAIATRRNTLLRLSFGHRSAPGAVAAIDHTMRDASVPLTPWVAKLAKRLAAYAAGEPDEFADIEVETSHLSPFAASIVELTRQIRFGETRSYGELALMAGRPRAARAVGRVMASNRTPLVVPCHRVVGCSGQLGGFSAIDGLRMKRRLLDLEASAAAPTR